MADTSDDDSEQALTDLLSSLSDDDIAELADIAEQMGEEDDDVQV